VDGENYRKVLYQRIGSVQRTQERGNERGLPIVAVDDVGGPNVFGDFNGGAAKFAVTLGIVGIFSGAAAVDSVAVEITRIIDEKNSAPR